MEADNGVTDVGVAVHPQTHSTFVQAKLITYHAAVQHTPKLLTASVAVQTDLCCRDCLSSTSTPCVSSGEIHDDVYKPSDIESDSDIDEKIDTASDNSDHGLPSYCLLPVHNINQLLKFCSLCSAVKAVRWWNANC